MRLKKKVQNLACIICSITQPTMKGNGKMEFLMDSAGSFTMMVQFMRDVLKKVWLNASKPSSLRIRLSFSEEASKTIKPTDMENYLHQNSSTKAIGSMIYLKAKPVKSIAPYPFTMVSFKMA